MSSLMQYPLLSCKFYIRCIPAAKQKPLTNTYQNIQINYEIRVTRAVKNTLEVTKVIKLNPTFQQIWEWQSC